MYSVAIRVQSLMIKNLPRQTQNPLFHSIQIIGNQYIKKTITLHSRHQVQKQRYRLTLGSKIGKKIFKKNKILNCWLTFNRHYKIYYIFGLYIIFRYFINFYILYYFLAVTSIFLTQFVFRKNVVWIWIMKFQTLHTNLGIEAFASASHQLPLLAMRLQFDVK